MLEHKASKASLQTWFQSQKPQNRKPWITGRDFSQTKRAPLSSPHGEIIQNLKVKPNTFPGHYKQVWENYLISSARETMESYVSLLCSHWMLFEFLCGLSKPRISKTSCKTACKMQQQPQLEVIFSPTESLILNMLKKKDQIKQST